MELWFVAILIVISMWMGYALGVSERTRNLKTEDVALSSGRETTQGAITDSGVTTLGVIPASGDVTTRGSISAGDGVTAWGSISASSMATIPESSSTSVAKQRTNIRNIRLGRVTDLRKKRNETTSHVGWAIGSPAQGELSFITQGIHKGFMIVSTQGQLFSPASGKITRLFPTGNALRLRTEDGIEVTMTIGSGNETLTGTYFRPRVVQNEFVTKGKLLLEYDVEGIQEEGGDTAIRMIIEGANGYRSVEYSQNKTTRVGEHLLWVRK